MNMNMHRLSSHTPPVQSHHLFAALPSSLLLSWLFAASLPHLLHTSSACDTPPTLPHTNMWATATRRLTLAHTHNPVILSHTLPSSLTLTRHIHTHSPLSSANLPSSDASSTSLSSATPTIDFGYQQVPKNAKQEMVHEVFERVAGKYDAMNDAMSLGIHRVWKHNLIHQLLKPQPGSKLLDVAGGTGDVAFRFLSALQAASPPPFYSLLENINTSSTASPSPSSPSTSINGQVVVCDINEHMLGVGIDRAEKQYNYTPGPLIFPATTPENKPEQIDVEKLRQERGHIAFVVGNAEQLPFPSNTFDYYTIAFGLRNVTNRDAALSEAHRVLKKGGRFVCLEFSKVVIPGMDQMYEQYSMHIIPVLGHLLANDRASYQYLVESIRLFPNQQTLADMMRQAGFRGVNYQNWSGGIVAAHSGFKL